MSFYLKYFFVLLYSFFYFNVQAQEQLQDLYYNIECTNKVEHQNQRSMLLGLPFTDDFSYNGPYPSVSLWVDQNVFVNNTYSLDQPTMGMATFDGLNKDGVPYKIAPVTQGSADTLTSQVIDLSPYSISDSLYLSFYYQSGGLGQTPEINDSLIVEALDNTGNWQNVWRKEGSASYAFKLAMIPLLNPNLFHTNFQFRFRNLATLSGNNDHWNIDYVKLYDNRTIADTLLNDVACSIAPKSFLNPYKAMPYKQFEANPTAYIDTHAMYLRNNALLADNCLLACEIYNTGAAAIDFNPSPVANIIGSQSDFSYTFATPTITMPIGATSNIITSKYIADPGSAISNINNDTITTQTILDNYYAYDDGTAERAYALEVSFTQLAYKFQTEVGDTLQYIAIHWAHITTDVSNKLINLKVWSAIDETGASSNEDTIAVLTLQKPRYIDQLNGFAYYRINRWIPAGTFYIGWQQIDPDKMNIGWDVNSNASNNIFINAFGFWQQTVFTGALLMRPYMGSYFNDPTTINEMENNIINIFPNPSNDIIQIQCAKEYNKLRIQNAFGQQVIETSKQDVISIEELPSGIYFISLFLNNNKVGGTKKIIKL